MAKGSAMGLWRGKKGSSVFYKIKNSNSAQKQGIRERIYEVSNPQTSAQAAQRMKLLPAQRVYGALKETIERSWQGVPYGEMTRQQFLKAALREDVFPAVDKGSNVVVPGPYLIAKGTLPSVSTAFDDDGLTFDFPVSSQLESTSVSAITQWLISSGEDYKVGDQFTIVICYLNSGFAAPQWFTFSFYLSLEDDTDIANLVPNGLDIEAGGYRAEGFHVIASSNVSVVAGACVVSRDAATPLRSTASLVVRTAALPEYYGSTAIARARASYMKRKSSAETDWPVDPDDPITINARPVTLDAQGVYIDDTTGGSVTGGANYNVGDPVTLSATAKTGYAFGGWFGSRVDAIANTNKISDNATLEFVAGDTSVVGENTAFFARFKANA